MTKTEICTYLDELSEHPFELVWCERMNGSSDHWNYQKHQHSYLEIIFFLNGRLEVDTPTERLNVKTYSLLFYPPGVEHRELKSQALDQEVIAFGVKAACAHVPAEAFLTSDRDGRFPFLCSQIYENFYHPASRSEALCDLYLRALLCTASQQFSEEHAVPYNVAHTISEYIQHNFMMDLSLEQLADLAFISPSYLSRIFQKEFHTTPMKYVKETRLREAGSLLKTTSFSVSEIAERVGFASVSYFWRAFKQEYGVSPSEYRGEKG